MIPGGNLRAPVKDGETVRRAVRLVFWFFGDLIGRMVAEVMQMPSPGDDGGDGKGRGRNSGMEVEAGGGGGIERCNYRISWLVLRSVIETSRNKTDAETEASVL